MIKRALGLVAGTLFGYALGALMLVVWASNKEYRPRLTPGHKIKYDRFH